LLAAVVPFVAAIALLLISPLLAAKVKAVVHGKIVEDLVQILPLTLLPVTGAVFAIAVHVPSGLAVEYLRLAVLAAIALEAWVVAQPAGKYVTRGLFGYSVSTVIGIVSNLLGLAMILVYGP
jgi:hypothetical protein